MLRRLRAAIIVALSLALSACPAPRRPAPAPQPAQPETPVLKPVPGAKLLQVVPADSLLRILVYRGGTLSQAGHNHVIASHDITGRVYLHEDIEKSAFELNIPVGTFTVDEAELRREEGADFPPEVPEPAKEGTRKNMLSEALLDGERYPVVRVVSGAVKGTRENAAVGVHIGVKDRWCYLITPIRLQFEGDRVAVSGELALRQSDLGLKPFSVLMGALQVQDLMKIRFRVVAELQE